MQDLSDTQRRFAAIITHADGVPGALSADARAASDLVPPSARLSPEEQLEIYARAYLSRLEECLGSDYEATRHALGDDGFSELARRFVAACPSRGPNLNGYGKELPAFVAADAALDEPLRGFVASLARLEWAMVEVFHAPLGEALARERLDAVPASAWGSACFRLRESVRLLRLAFPADAYLQAFRDGREPAIPEARTTVTAVYRVDDTVWRLTPEPALGECLAALAEGETLGAALERASGADASDTLAGRVMAAFRLWVRDGLFSAIEVA